MFENNEVQAYLNLLTELAGVPNKSVMVDTKKCLKMLSAMSLYFVLSPYLHKGQLPTEPDNA